MKKVLCFLLMAFVAAPVVMFAQDSTSIVGGSTGDLIGGIVGAVTTKYPIVGVVGTGLFLVSEVLAAIPGVKANSVFQAIHGLFGKLFGK